MKRVVVPLLIWAAFVRPAPAADALELRDGDRVIFLGGTFIEREQKYGYWETVLTLRHADKHLTFRNLGWSGDTVWSIPGPNSTCATPFGHRTRSTDARVRVPRPTRTAGAATGPGAFLTGAGGAALGAGAGTAIGGSLFDIAYNLIGGRIDTRSPLQRVAETGTEFLAGAVGQRAGELAPQAIKSALGTIGAKSQQLMAAYARLHVPAPAGAVTGSRAVGSLEKMLESTPAGGGVMQKNAEAVLRGVGDAADDIARQFGAVQTKTGAGATIRQAAMRAAERFGFKQEAAYQEAFDLVGADSRVGTAAIKALRTTMERELSTAPRSLARALDPALQTLRQIELDALAPQGLTFQALRQVRTMIGQELDTPMLVGGSGAQNAALKRIYGALTEDMSAAARAAGPEAARKLALADRYTRLFMNTAAKTLDKIDRFDADEKAFNYIVSLSKDGAGLLGRLRRQFEAEEWDAVAATVLHRLGQATPGAQDATGRAFSVNTFLTNWNRMLPEARQTLFGGSRYKELTPLLDDLVTVAGSLKDMEKLANTSNTGRVMIAHMTLTTLMAGLGGLAGGTPGAFAGAGAQVAAPWVGARLLTSPSFVRWLTTPVTEVNGLAAHLGRLVAIAEAEPEIKDAIYQYLAALRISTPLDAADGSAPQARQRIEGRKGR